MHKTEKNGIYSLVDIVKVLLALLILLSHFINEYAAGKLPRIVDLSVSVYIIAVPMFFAYSGYFLFKKLYVVDEIEQRRCLKDYCVKILRLYGVWSAVYVLFKIFTWIRFAPENGEIISYIHRAIVYSTYNTIWYLPASAAGAVMAYFFLKKFGSRGMLITAAIFCVLGAMGDCYYNITSCIPIVGKIFEVYLKIFITSRNGIFNGFPYIALGAFIAQLRSRDEKTYYGIFNRWFFLSAASGAVFIGEALFAKMIVGSNNSNTIITLFIFTFFAVYWSITSVQPAIDKKLSGNLRKMSTAIFLSQRLFLSALPGLLPGTVFSVLLAEKGWMVGLCWVTVCTIAFSALLILLSGKIKFLKYFYQ
ncbi:MAG: acyltransferase [Alistipes sp.]|nr:acyltransferase [Alistipes sp.]